MSYRLSFTAPRARVPIQIAPSGSSAKLMTALSGSPLAVV